MSDRRSKLQGMLKDRTIYDHYPIVSVSQSGFDVVKKSSSVDE